MLMLSMGSKKSKPPLKIIIFAVAILAIASAGVGGYFWWQSQNQPQVQVTQTTNLPTTEPTRQDESEGTSFPVPSTVPDDAVRNYTLMTENEEFKIRHDGNGHFIVTLYPIANNSSQYGTYNDQLKQLKQHALDYLKEQKVDTTKAEIKYEPEEAASL